jgi:membrane protein insertase Oxa1/YidC/SpoIIIJ
MSPEQEQQQKMMQWMTLLFPLMLYGGPSGLNLYILTSTAIGIVESKIVRDHIKQREEEEKAGRVIVDAGKKFKRSDGGGMASRKPADEPKPGGLKGWLARLQERAEQVRRDADKRK